MKSHYKAKRISSAQMMATMRTWPNMNPGALARGEPHAAKEGDGEVAAFTAKRAWAGGKPVLMAESRNVTVTYKRRRTFAPVPPTM